MANNGNGMYFAVGLDTSQLKAQADAAVAEFDRLNEAAQGGGAMIDAAYNGALQSSAASAAAMQDAIGAINEQIALQQGAIGRIKDDWAAAYDALKQAQANGDNEGEAAALATLQELNREFTAEAEILAQLQGQLSTINGLQNDAATSNQENTNSLVALLGGQEKYNEILGHLPEPLKNAISGISGMTKAAAAFIATPLGATIAVIVGALKLLTTWFNSTAAGQTALTKITGYFNGVLGQLKEIAIAAGEWLYKAFTNPRAAVADLWGVIQSQFINRMKGFTDMLKALGELMQGVFEMDTTKMAGAATKILDAWLKIGTGIDDVRGKVTAWAKGVNDVANETAQLEERSRQLTAARAAWANEEAKLQAERNRLQNEYIESGRTDVAKLQAAEEATNKIYNKRVEFAKEEHAIKKRLNELTSSTQEDINEEARLLAAVTQVEAERQQALRRIKSGIASGMGAGSSTPTPTPTTDDNNATAIANYKAELQKKVDAQIKAFRDQKKAEQEHAAEEKAAMDKYLAEYGNYWERRKAIAELYADKIAKATTEGERKTLAAQRDKEIGALDEKAASSGAAISQMFADVGNKSRAELDAIIARGREALAFIKGGKFDAEKGVALGISSAQFQSYQNDPTKIANMEKQLDTLSKTADGMASPFEKAGAALDDLFKAKNPTAAIAAVQALTAAVGQIGNAVGYASDALATMGDALGSDVLAGAAEALGDIQGVMNSTMQGAQAGAAFGPWGAAAGAALGAISSLTGVVSKWIDKAHEAKITALQTKIDDLSEAYNTLGEAIDGAYSHDANELYKKQNANLRQQQQLIRQQIEAEKSKKKTDDERVKQWEAQLKEIDAQIKENETAAIDAIFGEGISSAIDNFANALADAWTGGKNAAADAHKFVRDMIKKMVIEAMKADISAPMEKIREMMTAAMADGVVTAEEQDVMNAAAEQLANDLQNKYSWSSGLFGNTADQSGTKSAFTTMSQETGEELNGRFTAVQMATEATRIHAEQIAASAMIMTTQLTTMTAGISDLQGLALSGVNHLDDIARNTRRLHEIADDIAIVKQHTARL